MTKPAVFMETLLQQILSQPTAPFREAHVSKVILATLSEAGVPHFQDPVGNIVLGVATKAEYLKLIAGAQKDPLRFFIAHLDHPGFHGVNWLSPNRLEIKWHGGSPVEHLEKAPVWLADAQGWVGEGQLTEVKLKSQSLSLTKYTIDCATVEVTRLDRHQPKANTLFGGYRFRSPWWQEEKLLYTKAADDLVGSFAVVSLALDLFSQNKKKKPKKTTSQIPFLGLLTRAEEVGFIGAIGHFELGWLQTAKRPVVCVSLETSRTFPGAEIGKGPVLRLGDKTTVFSANELKTFADMASAKMQGRFQKRVMEGGTCEATAAIAYGFPSVGISIPLGNYHNQSFEGGPDSIAPMGPAPEFVHLDDLAGMLELARGLLDPKLNWKDPWKEMRKKFSKSFRTSKKLLSI